MTRAERKMMERIRVHGQILAFVCSTNDKQLALALEKIKEAMANEAKEATA